MMTATTKVSKTGGTKTQGGQRNNYFTLNLANISHIFNLVGGHPHFQK
jgi:hypothetical protein